MGSLQFSTGIRSTGFKLRVIHWIVRVVYAAENKGMVAFCQIKMFRFRTCRGNSAPLLTGRPPRKVSSTLTHMYPMRMTLGILHQRWSALFVTGKIQSRGLAPRSSHPCRCSRYTGMIRPARDLLHGLAMPQVLDIEGGSVVRRSRLQDGAHALARSAASRLESECHSGRVRGGM